MGKRRFFTFLYALTPTLLWLGIQVVLSAGYGIFWLLLSGPAQMYPAVAAAMDYLEKEGLYILSILMDLIFLVPGAFWFLHLLGGGRRKKEEAGAADPESYAGTARQSCERAGSTGRRKMAAADCISAVCLGLMMQVLGGILLMLVAIAAPELMEEYASVTEALGLGSPSVWSLVYGVLVAPVAEELIYRGLTMKIMERSFPFWAANLVQAALFGLMHMNLVQSSYAFLMGLVLGAAAKKYGTLKGAVICHFAVNLSGNLIGYLPYPYLSRLVLLVLSGGIFLSLWYREREASQKNTF